MTETMTPAIPVISLADLDSKDRAARERLAAEIGAACRGPGFMIVTDHGVPQGLRDGVFDAAKAFFAKPNAVKDALSIEHSPHNRGYVRLGGERLDPQSGAVDSKEAFNIGLDLPADDPRVLAGEPFRGVNLWPEDASFREATLAYFNAAWDLGVRLHRAFSIDLGLPDENWFAPHFTAPMATLRLLRYPAGGDSGEIGAGAHTDYGSVTLLATDGVAGLQVRPRDAKAYGRNWIDAPNVPGGLVVNIGDCLMRWTNDVYVSTPHRVLAPPAERLSIAFFLDPNPDSDITPLPSCVSAGRPAAYPPINGADYLAERLNATYDHRKDAKP